MLMPKRVKRRRVHRGRMKGVATKGNTITYGTFGLVSQECGWITSNQIEAARIAMTRSIKRGGKVYIKIFPHKSVTKKPAEVRMGCLAITHLAEARLRHHLRARLVDAVDGRASCRERV